MTPKEQAFLFALAGWWITKPRGVPPKAIFQEVVLAARALRAQTTDEKQNHDRFRAIQWAMDRTISPKGHVYCSEEWYILASMLEELRGS